MSRRVLCGALTLVIIGLAAPTVAQSPTPSADPAATVVFRGQGNAHGMGLAMDGVRGMFGAGWSYTRILDTFYVGTQTSNASGPMRVGLATAGEHGFDLPGGGTVTTSTGTTQLPDGAQVFVRWVEGRYIVRAPGLVGAAQAEPPIPLPTPTPAPSGSPSPAPGETPAPSATPPPPATAAPAGAGSTTPVSITPHGNPALVRVHATGKRYRGRIEVRLGEGGLWAINHVDLETYVQGIAEEKGAGWTVEGLKVLAVAARSLAAATRTWYSRHHTKGFDICPTEMCQVYYGYDGEFGDMTQATRATSGEIRTYGGRAILAMYHGNGGGQTDTYKLIYGDGVTDAHPYLQSVTYPFAKPKEWSFAFTPEQATAALRAGGIAVPGAFRTIEVLKRGESPRVVRLRVVGSEGTVETSGHAFRSALGLTSIWFELAPPDTEAPPVTTPIPVVPEAGEFALPSFEPTRSAAAPPEPPGRRLPLQALAVFLIALVAAGGPALLRRRESPETS